MPIGAANDINDLNLLPKQMKRMLGIGSVHSYYCDIRIPEWVNFPRQCFDMVLAYTMIIIHSYLS